jgi:hypothetical protein
MRAALRRTCRIAEEQGILEENGTLEGDSAAQVYRDHPELIRPTCRAGMRQHFAVEAEAAGANPDDVEPYVPGGFDGAAARICEDIAPYITDDGKVDTAAVLRDKRADYASICVAGGLWAFDQMQNPPFSAADGREYLTRVCTEALAQGLMDPVSGAANDDALDRLSARVLRDMVRHGEITIRE